MGKILERTVHYNGKEIAYQLEFKSIKNINLHVYADGRVSISAPLGTSKKYIDELVLANAERIAKSKQKLQTKQEQRQSQKLALEDLLCIEKQQLRLGEFVIPLRIIEGVLPEVAFKDGIITIMQPDINNISQQHQLIMQIIKNLAGYCFFDLVMNVCFNLREFNVPIPQLKVRDMKTRWGSWNVPKHIMTLNSKLVFFPKRVIEYIIVHEFCHYFEANHSAKFYAWLDKLQPDWRERKQLLNEWALRLP